MSPHRFDDSIPHAVDLDLVSEDDAFAAEASSSSKPTRPIPSLVAIDPSKQAERDQPGKPSRSVRTLRLRKASTIFSAVPNEWSLRALSGQLTEISSPHGGASSLSLASRLVLDAQRQGEPVAWLMNESGGVFPPDLASGGIDLDALAVVRLSGGKSLAKAAEQLARSGAFGLLIFDLDTESLAQPIQTRLLGCVRKHSLALVFLTRKPPEASSLGSTISLRGQAVRRRRKPGQVGSGFEIAFEVLKDKRRGPGWIHREGFHGPDGLR